MAFAERNARSNEEALRDLLLRQHGVATTRQLGDLGISPSAVTRRVRSGELERVLPRVYRSPLVPPTVAQVAMGAVLWAGPDAVASHRTAAALWGIDGLPSPDRVEVWVPSVRSPSHARVLVHRGAVVGNDRRLVDRIPITSPARTIIDLAGVLGPEDLESAIEDLLRRGLTTPSAVERRLAALGGPGRNGAARLRSVLAQRDQAPLESRLEVKVWRVLRAAGLRPVRQFEVRCEGVSYRLDFAWPRLKVAVEADGFRAHGGRVAHVADRRRLTALVAAGWSVILVTWEEITSNPDRVVERVRSTLLRA